jgi:hypothetical protein
MILEQRLRNPLIHEVEYFRKIVVGSSIVSKSVVSLFNDPFCLDRSKVEMIFHAFIHDFILELFFPLYKSILSKSLLVIKILEFIYIDSGHVAFVA